MRSDGGFIAVLGAVDEAAFAKAMKARFTRPDASGKQRFAVLDCHDQSLRSSERLLIECGDTLFLLQANGRYVSQNAIGNGRFPRDLPDGPVRDALKGFPKLRALMTIASGEVDSGICAKHRFRLMTLVSQDGQATLVLVPRARTHDTDLVRVRNTLEKMATTHCQIDDLMQHMFPGMSAYRAKPPIRLRKHEPVLEVATDILRTYLSVARQNEDGLIADIDTEFLHDYRVSLRRIRSVLSLFKGVFSRDQTADLKRRFAALMTPTGRMRDLDVWLLKKGKFISVMPPNLHSGAHEMFDLFRAERERELSQLTQWFRSDEYAKITHDLTALTETTGRLEPGPNADRGAYRYACALIWKRYRKICKRARSISDETPDDTVHALRIDCKKLRYLMESFGPLFPADDFRTILKPLKKLQDVLGKFNDCSVQQQKLQEFIDQHSDAKAQLAMAAGGLIAVLNQRQRAERAKVIANLQHFDSPNIRRVFRVLFHTPAK